MSKPRLQQLLDKHPPGCSGRGKRGQMHMGSRRQAGDRARYVGSTPGHTVLDFLPLVELGHTLPECGLWPERSHEQAPADRVRLNHVPAGGSSSGSRPERGV